MGRTMAAARTVGVCSRGVYTSAQGEPQSAAGETPLPAVLRQRPATNGPRGFRDDTFRPSSILVASSGVSVLLHPGGRPASACPCRGAALASGSIQGVLVQREQEECLREVSDGLWSTTLSDYVVAVAGWPSRVA